MTRIAAVGDIHFSTEHAGSLRPYWSTLHEHADLFLLAGDLTRIGTAQEAEVLAAELSVVQVPVVAVLGNHDYHSGQQEAVVTILQDAGVTVLESSSTVLDIRGVRVGIAGGKGFGGGFAGACASAFGEPEMKAFIGHTHALADRLERQLRDLSADLKIALLHYAPIDATIEGEKRQIYPFLGSYLLGEAIDRAGADIVFHGHAHLGREKGVTPGGIAVRNVAQPVLRHAYNVYCIGREELRTLSTRSAAALDESC